MNLPSRISASVIGRRAGLQDDPAVSERGHPVRRYGWRRFTPKPPCPPRPVAFREAASITIQAFRKALNQLPLTSEDRDELTTDELFVLVLARRLERLTTAEQERMRAADRHYLASAGLIASDAGQPASATGGTQQK